MKAFEFNGIPSDIGIISELYNGQRAQNCEPCFCIPIPHGQYSSYVNQHMVFQCLNVPTNTVAMEMFIIPTVTFATVPTGAQFVISTTPDGDRYANVRWVPTALPPGCFVILIGARMPNGFYSKVWSSQEFCIEPCESGAILEACVNDEKNSINMIDGTYLGAADTNDFIGDTSLVYRPWAFVRNFEFFLAGSKNTMSKFCNKAYKTDTVLEYNVWSEPVPGYMAIEMTKVFSTGTFQIKVANKPNLTGRYALSDSFSATLVNEETKFMNVDAVVTVDNTSNYSCNTCSTEPEIPCDDIIVSLSPIIFNNLPIGVSTALSGGTLGIHSIDYEISSNCVAPVPPTNANYNGVSSFSIPIGPQHITGSDGNLCCVTVRVRTRCEQNGIVNYGPYHTITLGQC